MLESQPWPSSKTNGCPINWLMASSSKGIHWPLTQECLSDSLLHGPDIGIELHDYLWVVLSHGWHKLSPLPLSNFLLKLSILSVPQLDSPLLEERPAFNGLKSSLVFHKFLHMKILSRIGARARIGVAGKARLCGSRVLSGGPLLLSRCPLLDRHWIGRVFDAGRKAWLVLGIWVSVVRGLLGFQPSRSWSHSVGISFLILCSTCSKSPIARAGRSDIIEVSPLQAYFNPLARKFQICKARGHVPHQPFIVEQW